jgi:hypothetical protein
LPQPHAGAERDRDPTALRGRRSALRPGRRRSHHEHRHPLRPTISEARSLPDRRRRS